MKYNIFERIIILISFPLTLILVIYFYWKHNFMFFAPILYWKEFLIPVIPFIIGSLVSFRVAKKNNYLK